MAARTVSSVQALPTSAASAVAARFVRVEQTGSKQGLYWSVHELHLYGEGNPLPQ